MVNQGKGIFNPPVLKFFSLQKADPANLGYTGILFPLALFSLCACALFFCKEAKLTPNSRRQTLNQTANKFCTGSWVEKGRGGGGGGRGGVYSHLQGNKVLAKA